MPFQHILTRNPAPHAPACHTGSVPFQHIRVMTRRRILEYPSLSFMISSRVQQSPASAIPAVAESAFRPGVLSSQVSYRAQTSRACTNLGPARAGCRLPVTRGLAGQHGPDLPSDTKAWPTDTTARGQAPCGRRNRWECSIHPGPGTPRRAAAPRGRTSLPGCGLSSSEVTGTVVSRIL